MLESTRRDQLSPPRSSSEVSFKGLLNSDTFTFWSHHKGKIKWKATLAVLCTAAFAIFEIYISVCLFQWVSRKATLVLSAAYFKWITVSGGQALLSREQVNKVLTAIFTIKLQTCSPGVLHPVWLLRSFCLLFLRVPEPWGRGTWWGCPPVQGRSLALT